MGIGYFFPRFQLAAAYFAILWCLSRTPLRRPRPRPPIHVRPPEPAPVSA